MKSVINELYNGEIFPVETETLKDEKYRRTVNRVGREIEELEELLTEEQYKKLEHIRCQTEIHWDGSEIC